MLSCLVHYKSWTIFFLSLFFFSSFPYMQRSNIKHPIENCQIIEWTTIMCLGTVLFHHERPKHLNFFLIIDFPSLWTVGGGHCLLHYSMISHRCSVELRFGLRMAEALMLSSQRCLHKFIYNLAANMSNQCISTQEMVPFQYQANTP